MGRKGKGKVPGVTTVEPEKDADFELTASSDLQAGGLGMSLQEAQAMIADDPQASVLHDAELARIMQAQEPIATAPTVECTGHVADEHGKQCRLCSKPLSLLSPGQRTLAMVRREGVPGPALDMTWSVQLSELWHSRLVMLAERDQMSPSEYAECLIRRQWVASGGAKR